MRLIGLPFLLLLFGCSSVPGRQDRLLGDWIDLQGKGTLVFRADGTGEIFRERSVPETFYYRRIAIKEWEAQWAREHGSRFSSVGIAWLARDANEVVVISDTPSKFPSSNHLFYREKDQTLHNFMDGYVKSEP